MFVGCNFVLICGNYFSGVALDIDCSLRIPVDLSVNLLKRAADEGAFSHVLQLLRLTSLLAHMFCLSSLCIVTSCQSLSFLFLSFPLLLLFSLSDREIDSPPEAAIGSVHEAEAVVLYRGNDKVKVMR